MIPVMCETYDIDLIGLHWPTIMCCRPIVGDIVFSSNGEKAKIIRVSHSFAQDNLSARLVVELGI